MTVLERIEHALEKKTDMSGLTRSEIRVALGLSEAQENPERIDQRHTMTRETFLNLQREIYLKKWNV